ncbi:MAG: phospholipase D-like domain-containing protein [Sandaracinaceae bacterium]
MPPRDVDLTAWPISLDLPIASFHQKFATVDGRVAFVGGMNLRRVDWDTDDHLIFEPRRMLFDSTTAERMDVVDRTSEPDTGPRKDYMTRIEGPVVQDVDDLFEMRWSHQLDEGVEYSENASDFVVRRDQPVYADGVQAQLTATLPIPYEEHAIAETWFNAVANAERYIFIEDQYFRIPMLVDAIVERMTMVPELQLIVITKPVSDWTDPGCEWTARTDQDLRTRFPTRYSTFQLRAFDYVLDTFLIDEWQSYFADMDVHSKLLIVDDTFLSVGSCNKNNRGIVYEGELNLAVFDPTWVRDARRRILANMLPEGTAVSDDAGEWITQIAEAASWNQYVWDNWDAAGGDLDYDGTPPTMEYIPAGFLYPLSFVTPDDCLVEGVGPDMT